jgi:nucleoside-diphosphate-sugar epimerase
LVSLGKQPNAQEDDPERVAAQQCFHSSERVLVTGGSGFIGTNLVEVCLGGGITVMSLDPEPPRNDQQRHIWKKADTLNGSAVKAAVSDFSPTLVFHLGARTDLHGKTTADYAQNIQGVQAVIDACNATPSIRRVIFASSRLVCRIGYQPKHDEDYCATTPYGQSKVVGEQIVRAANHSYEWLIVRPTSIWGPWFAIPYRDFFDSVARGRYFHVRDKSVRKSFGYVGNTVHELVRLGYAPDLLGRTLYLGDYPPTDLREMASLIQRYTGARDIRTIPLWPLRAVARAGDLLQRAGWPEPPLTSFRLNNLLTEMVYDMNPLRDAVGPLPYSLDDGVRATVSWIRQQTGGTLDSSLQPDQADIR